MGVVDLIYYVEDILDDFDDDIVECDEYTVVRDYSGNMMKLTLYSDNDVVGEIVTDNTVYFNITGVEFWEDFVDCMGW